MDPTPHAAEEAVVRHALAQQLVTPAQVAEARRAAAAQRVPLLQALGPLLPPERRAELAAVFRQASDPRARSGLVVAPTLAAPPPVVAQTVVTPPPGQTPATLAAPPPTPAAPARLDPARERAVAALRAVQDPRFAPHLDLVLERKELLGQGGMGVVHRVLDRRLGREAALKVMRTAEPHPVDAARFLREAEVTARLDHPAIPPVYEAGTDAAGRLFLLMRVIEGQPLSALVDAAHASPPPTFGALRPLLEALVKVGEAIAYAHSRRMVHRDLKPANVMVGQFGEVLVMDWGLVRLLDEPDDSGAAGKGTPGEPEAGPRPLTAADERRPRGRPGSPTAAPESRSDVLTQAGALMGTPGYMAPEQAGGEAISEKTDVYALGAMLVTLLTGRPPVEGDTVMNVVHRTLQGQVEGPRSRWAACPRELDALALAALAQAPGARPTAAGFVADLRAFLAGDELRAYRYGPVERALRAARRRPAALVGVAGLLAVTAVGAGLGAQVSSARVATEQAEGRRRIAQLEREQAAAVAAQQSATTVRVDGALLALRTAEGLLASGLPGPATDRVRRASDAASDAAAVRWQAAQVLARAGDRDGARALVDPDGSAALSYADLLFLHDLDVADDPEASVHGERDVRPTLARRARVVKTPLDERAARYVDGLAAVAAGDDAAALAAFDEVARAGPGFPWARLERARLRLRQNDPALADEDLVGLVLLASDPEVLWQALLLRCRLRLGAGSAEEARADADRALALFPARRSALLLRAMARLGTSDVRGCREDLAAAEEEPRWRARARALRARSYLFGEIDFTRAAAEARRAIEADPSLSDAHGALAEALLASVPPDAQDEAVFGEAEAAVRRARELAPAKESWRALELRLLLQRRRLDEAARGCDEFLGRYPRSAAVLGLRGQLRANGGDLEGALADLEKATRIAPSESVYVSGLAQVQAMKGDLTAARQTLDGLLARRPTFLEGRYTRLRVVLELQLAALDRALRPADAPERAPLRRVAIEDLSALIDAQPDSGTLPEWLLQRARLRADQLELGGAVDDAERVLRLRPPAPLALEARRLIVGLGWLLAPERVAAECAELARAGASTAQEHLSVYRACLNGHDPWAAAAAAADAVRRDPSSFDARLARAVTLAATGDLSGAQDEWEALVRLSPTSPTARLGRAGMRLARGDAPGARADADAAVADLAGYPAPLLVRARVREAQGDVSGAIADLEEALRRMTPIDQGWIGPARAELVRLRKKG